VYQWGPVGPTARFSGSGSRIPGSGRGGRGGNEEGADPRMGERGGKGSYFVGLIGTFLGNSNTSFRSISEN